MANKTIFLDMDGVLVKYRHEDFVGEDPNWLKPDYFVGLEADLFIKELAKSLEYFVEKEYYEESSIDLVILSKCSPEPSLFIRQSDEKEKWLVNEGLNSIRLVTTPLSKAKKAEAILGRSLSAHDILIDDYNPNLQEWEAAGGLGIKYGLGSRETWNGLSIQSLETSDEAFDFLTYLLR